MTFRIRPPSTANDNYQCEKRMTGCSRDLGGMSQLCVEKRCRCIAVPLEPHGENDPHPTVGQGAHYHAVTLAFLPFAPVVGLCSGHLEGRLPRELVDTVLDVMLGAPSMTSKTVSTATARHSQSLQSC